MRILVVGPTSPDAFADNILATLPAMGHEARAAGPARRVPSHRRLANLTDIVSERVRSLDARLQTQVVEAAQAFRPDLILSIDKRLGPSVVKELQRYAGRIVLWFPDHVANMARHEMFLAPYDRIFMKNPNLVQQLAGLHGLPVSYLPEAANPLWHKPIGDYGTQPYIVVAGNVHPTRAALLSRLDKTGVPLKIYGAPIAPWVGFPELRRLHAGHEVLREEKGAAFRGARAVLNNLHPGEWAGSNCRLFEATGSGALVLTEWREAMGDLFERGQEVLGFEDFDELVDQCRFALQDDRPGLDIADAAAARTLMDHTYEIRLRELLRVLDQGEN